MNKSNNAKVTTSNKSPSRSEQNCYDWRESRSFEIEDESMDLDQDRSMMGEATIEKMMDKDYEFNELGSEKGASAKSALDRSKGDCKSKSGQKDCDDTYNQSMDISMLDFSDML